jgi:DnaA family protein
VSSQLALNIQLRDDATLASYYPGDNHEAVDAVTKLSTGKGESFIYLWGKPGVGRTHLLQSACVAATNLGVSSVYIPFESNQKTTIQSLQNIDAVTLVCLDNINWIVGQPEWEEAVFHLFNGIRSKQGSLLIAADCTPQQLPIHLPDLKSRLTWGIVYHLHPLSDDQKLSAIQLRAHQRGIQLDDTVGRFLLTRCGRTMFELFQLLEQLDAASLTQQRRLTIPFVKQVLGV